MKLQWKITVDTGMMLALLLLMGYGLIGEKAHEWIGMGMFALFLAHLVFNRKWFLNLGKSRYGPVRIVQIVLNSLIFLCMVGCMVSGIALSRYLFHIQTEYTVEAAMEKAHMFCSYWGSVLMCLHLGTHWSMILAVARKHWKLPQTGRLVFEHNRISGCPAGHPGAAAAGCGGLSVCAQPLRFSGLLGTGQLLPAGLSFDRCPVRNGRPRGNQTSSEMEIAP